MSQDSATNFLEEAWINAYPDGVYPGGALNQAFKEVAFKVAEIAVQSLAAELVGARAEVDTLRFALNYYADKGKYDYELTAAPFETVPEIIYSDDCGSTARTALSQPTTQGIGAEVLRLAKKAYEFHEHLTDCKVIMGDDDEFRQAASALSLETIKLLEGLKDG